MDKYNLKKLEKDREKLKRLFEEGKIDPTYIMYVAGIEQVTTNTVRNYIHGKTKQNLALKREIIYELLKLVRNERN